MTVPTTATNLDPVTEDLNVSQGCICQVSVTWSPGSQWLNCFRVLYEGAQIIPSEGGGHIRGDGYPDTFPEHIILDKPHPTLNLEAWSDGNDYEHDVLISIIVLPIEPDMMKPIRDLIEILKRLIGL
ncbi:unnamed protein product [marine sediment metagenome]|uniref:Uncharacterized protein n=1 Tax=marine sediment metagenome TaxID=412755 RepID=X1B0R6_9ZZZZ